MSVKRFGSMCIIVVIVCALLVYPTYVAEPDNNKSQPISSQDEGSYSEFFSSERQWVDESLIYDKAIYVQDETKIVRTLVQQSENSL